MINIIYVHDLPFYSWNDGFFSASFTDEYFDRFLSAGSVEVEIISRVNVSGVAPEGYNCLSSDLIGVSSVLGSGYKKLINPTVIFELFRKIKKSNLVVLSTPSVNGFFLSLLCLLLGRKYICEVAGDYTAFATKRFGKVITLFLKYYMPWLVSKAVGATYVTIDLAKKYPNINSLIGSNVNIHNIFPRFNYSLNDSHEISIGFVGGLVERKGIRTIIKAAALLKNENPNPKLKFKFNFIGGHADNDWSSLCASLGVVDLCIFHGMKTRSEIDFFLTTFDIYIQPSFSEGVPRATIEAMSHGLPIIATTLPGFHEILLSDFLIQPGNERLLADSIYSLAINEELRRENGKRNLLRANDFLFSVMNQRRISFYREILDKIKI